MYRPVFDSAKRFWLRNITDLAERVNSETPWVAGFTVDDDQTVLHVTLSQNQIVQHDLTIRLTREVPATNYTEDREFRDQRLAEMKDLAQTLIHIIATEKTRDEHKKLDRAYKHQLKTIQPLAKSLTQQGAYVASVLTPKGHDQLTATIHPVGAAGAEPLVHWVVNLAPAFGLPDAEVLAAKQQRNDRLAELNGLLAHLNAATQPVVASHE